MKSTLFLIAAVATLALVQVAQAQDAASLQAAIERHYAAIHDGDFEAVWSHHVPEFSIFLWNGELLLESGFQEAAERQGFTPGSWTFNVAMNHFDAQIYGDVGLALFYLTGSYGVDDVVTTGTWRVSAVWVWRDGEWKEAHHHESPLIGSRHH